MCTCVDVKKCVCMFGNFKVESNRYLSQDSVVRGSIGLQFH